MDTRIHFYTHSYLSFSIYIYIQICIYIYICTFVWFLLPSPAETIPQVLAFDPDGRAQVPRLNIHFPTTFEC